MPNFIDHLIEESKRFLNGRAQINDDIGQEAAKFVMREIPPSIGTFEKSDSPLIRWLEEAIQFGSSETEGLLKALKPVLPFLPWKYNYEPRPDMPDLGSRMGWGEILGPEADLRSWERIRFIRLIIILQRNFMSCFRDMPSGLWTV